MSSEGRLYLVGGLIFFLGTSVLLLGGPGWLGGLVVAIALLAAGWAARLTHRRISRIRIDIEDEHLHPIPVLDAPKGTYDLATGLTLRVANRHSAPIGLRVDTILYERTRWQWDRRVSFDPPLRLLAPSVVAGDSERPFIVRNYTRVPPAIRELTPSFFVKLIVETSDLGKTVHRVFLPDHFPLPGEESRPGPVAAPGGGELLLPFRERARAVSRRGGELRALPGRVAAWLRALREPEEERPNVVRIDPRRKPADSLDGLIEELDSELEREDRQRQLSD